MINVGIIGCGFVGGALTDWLGTTTIMCVFDFYRLLKMALKC